MISPANKDRSAHRDAFVCKCATYLYSGVGLVIIDVVTDRLADLHGELLRRLGVQPAPGTPLPLYASAYRPVVRQGRPMLDLWREAIALGSPLPTMPLWLRGGHCLEVDFEATYERTCAEQRIHPAA